MKLSNIIDETLKLVTDGSFDILAQCTVSIEKRIFTFLEDVKYVDCINNNSNISCVICKEEHINLLKNDKLGIVISEQPKYSFFEIHNRISKDNKKCLSNNKTLIGTNCSISPSAIISKNNVVLGNNVTIEDFVVIKSHVSIGDNSIIRSGSVIGGQGYEFKRDKDFKILRVEHVGRTIIGENVEIKEFCSVHRAVFCWDYSLIDNGSRLDAHTHIGHATKVGENVMIGSHANLSGNIVVENNVYIGPGAIISNRLIIERNSKISIGSVVTKDVKANCVVTGNFAIDHDLFIKNLKQKNMIYENK